MEILLFEIGGVRCGVPATQVREVVRAVAIVPLPGAPPVVEGVIDVRGDLAAVLDLRARFGLPAKPLAATDHLVIAVAAGRLVAVRTDRVVDLQRVPDAGLAAIADLAPGTDAVSGIARLSDGIVLIHDLQTFLRGAEAQSLDEAVRAAAAGGAS